MRKHLLLSLVLAMLGLLAAPVAAVAKNEPVRQKINKAKKPRPDAKAPQQRAQAKAPQRQAQAKSPQQRPQAKAAQSRQKLAKKPLTRPAPSALAARPSTDTESRITRPGDYSFAIQQDGRTRTYRLHVPPGYAVSEPAPLVVALQGTTDQQDSDGLAALATESDRQGFVVVFPEAYRESARGKPVAWNAGNCCGDAREQKVNDVGFVNAVVMNVFRQMSIARYHIYAAGMSDGGMMAYRLACDLPHVFKAVASVAGTDNTAACTPDKPVSVLHIHARNDTRVPFNGAQAMPGSSKAANFSSARQTVSKWAELNGCMETPRPILDKAGASCEAYSYCRAQAEVQLCATDTGGHSWPGATGRRGPDSPSQALSATKVMLSFFKAH
jgi:polyhydroxybutyrate depolymerase